MTQYKKQFGLSRRDFGKIGVVGAVAIASGGPLAVANDEVDKGFIDAHVHVWTPDSKRYPLDKNYSVDDMQPPSFTPEELFEFCKPVGVNRVVLIQMSFYRYDNRYMTDMIAKHKGVFSGVGIVDHSAKNVAVQMKKLAKQGVKGFRVHGAPKQTEKWIDDSGMAKVWTTAAEENLSVCPLINPGSLPHIDSLCKKFPETRVVIDHFARIGISGSVDDGELDALCKLAKFPTVFVKTSAFYALGEKKPPYKDLIPMIRRVAEAYGPERLMWASDCPYQVQGEHTYAASIELITDHVDFFSEAEKQAVLSGTADKVFFT